jgi:uncharacterized phage protein gp47/JayE
MTTTFGVTPVGFVKKQATDIQASITAFLQAKFGTSFDLSTESVAGQFTGIGSDLIADVWDTIEAAYAAFTPDGASDVSLDNVCGLTGTKRQPATFSKVTVTLTGTPAASIPAATFSVAGTGAKFTMDADVTIGGGGTVSVTCTAVEAGPILAASGTLTVIDTPRAGLASVTNPTDAALGVNADTNSVLRRRREAELRSSGNAVADAIRGRVLALEDVNGLPIVSACTVFENDTDTTDGDGLPPHSVNVLASCATGAGIDTAVAQAVYASKGAGIQTVGATSVSVNDSQGVAHTVKFDRPSEIDVYVRLDLIVDPNFWPADGAAQVIATVVAYGAASLVSGKDVVSSVIAAQALQVAGVLDTGGLAKLSTAPSPTLTSNISISLRQIAKLDTGRVAVFTSNGTP